GMAQAQGSMVSTIAIPVSESGIYNVDFTFGNATVNEVLSINVPVAPTAAIPAEVALSENEAITLNGMFTNANSYEWAVDGVVFSTEANPTWTASTEGIYNIAVTVRSEDGCSASDNMVAEVSKSVTSINDVNAVFQITQDAYSVVVLTDADGFMIEMIAMDGKLVASALANQGANVLSTQALAAGVYEVRLSSANGVVGSQKVLVK
ncbi:MAG: T9SS type A sorting domain-containing protein, partial [Chitinophagales bacterium]